MKTRILIAPVLLGSALSLGACSDNYAVEGAVAGAAAGAGIAAITDGDVEEGAAIGAAVGGVGGYFVDKDGKCYQRDRNGDRYRVDCRD